MSWATPELNACIERLIQNNNEISKGESRKITSDTKNVIDVLQNDADQYLKVLATRPQQDMTEIKSAFTAAVEDIVAEICDDYNELAFVSSDYMDLWVNHLRFHDISGQFDIFNVFSQHDDSWFLPPPKLNGKIVKIVPPPSSSPPLPSPVPTARSERSIGSSSRMSGLFVRRWSLRSILFSRKPAAHQQMQTPPPQMQIPLPQTQAPPSAPPQPIQVRLYLNKDAEQYSNVRPALVWQELHKQAGDFIDARFEFMVSKYLPSIINGASSISQGDRLKCFEMLTKVADHYKEMRLQHSQQISKAYETDGSTSGGGGEDNFEQIQEKYQDIAKWKKNFGKDIYSKLKDVSILHILHSRAVIQRGCTTLDDSSKPNQHFFRNKCSQANITKKYQY